MKSGWQNSLLQTCILLLASVLVIILFISYSASMGYWGFPLDDAWIHQVYARNLVFHGEWAFNPGEPSGGSTAPLWSLLLSVAFLISVQPVVWVAILGCLTLLGIGLLAENLFRTWSPKYTSTIPWIGLFFILEWHLIWAAASGMETALFSGLILGVFWTLRENNRRYWLAGLLIGISTWIRPDGMTLLGPAFMFVILRSGDYNKKVRHLAEVLGFFLLLFIPYLIFNLMSAGDIWPTTFSAKQAEYQTSLSLPLLERVWMIFLPFLAGGGVILLPGVLASVWIALQKRMLPVLTMFAWMLGFILLYAIRLPVNYQHGRYMMPAMGCYFLIGLWGMAQVMNRWQETRLIWVAKRFWIGTLAVIVFAFLYLGIKAYQTDVAIIETEMVRTAGWIKQNTPPESRIAAHDIGALGYFANRKIIDLAGLVNPEVIPIIRNESALSDYLEASEVDYLVTFPKWYPHLVVGKELLFSTGGLVSLQAGGENMAVYSWRVNK